MKRLLLEYKVEITVFVGLVLGLMLVVYEFNLPSPTDTIHAVVVNGLWASLVGAADALGRYIQTASSAHLTGVLTICLSSSIFALRLRQRWMKSARFQNHACPHCGGGVRRVHRTQLDRILGKTLFPNTRRFRCSEGCGWEGLLHYEREFHFTNDFLVGNVGMAHAESGRRGR